MASPFAPHDRIGTPQSPIVDIDMMANLYVLGADSSADMVGNLVVVVWWFFIGPPLSSVSEQEGYHHV